MNPEEVMRGARLCCVLLRVMAVLLCGQGYTCSALCPCMLRGVAAGGVEAFTVLSALLQLARRVILLMLWSVCDETCWWGFLQGC